MGQGAHAKFAAIVQEHSKSLTRYARHLTGDASSAADLLQDTLLRGWNSWKQNPKLDTDNHRAWLFSIMRNKAMNDRRDALYRAIKYRNFGIAEQRREEAYWMTDGTAHVELLDVLERLDELPEEYRVILIELALGEEQEDIAIRQGIPKGTVKSRSNRARKRLAELVETRRTR